jgi:alpha/beta superfamily hydrolase
MKSGVVGVLLALVVNYAIQAKGVKSDSVTYTRGKITYGATFSLPDNSKKVPAVIFISGTGPQDRDGSMAGFKFFAELASYLNGRGIAVLRIDDRGVGKTTGIYQQATTEDFAQDIEAGIDF